MKSLYGIVFALIVGACTFVFMGADARLGATPSNLPRAVLYEAPLLKFPGKTDCNSPAHWDGDTFYLFNSIVHPARSQGKNIRSLSESSSIKFGNAANGGRWIEATFKDDDGILYGWYHNEPDGVCRPDMSALTLTAPRIGAVKSNDNGATWQDLGIILEMPANQLHCTTANHYFAGGNGDFSVILDGKREYFYFLVSAYGDLREQGVAVARMLYADRNAPVGKVWKWHQDEWGEPGIGGHLTPTFPVTTDWHRPDADAFWGPSVHWNSYLGQYVMLLNRAKDKDWSQEGVYVSFNRDLSQPDGWSPPTKILDGGSWYPQVIGTSSAKHETDKTAGRMARFFMSGQSRSIILFLKPWESEPDFTFAAEHPVVSSSLAFLTNGFAFLDPAVLGSRLSCVANS